MNAMLLWIPACLAVLLFECPMLRGAVEMKTMGVPAELDFLGYSTNSATALEKGRSDAHRDLSNGVVRLPSYGLPTPWSTEYDRILKDEYHIESYGLGGCIVSQGLVSYAKGYSEVTCKFIEARHGTNFFEKIQKQAEQAYSARIDANAKKTRSQGIYRIQAGDSLVKIARQHGVTVKALAAANPDVNAARLQIGHLLKLPAGTQ